MSSLFLLFGRLPTHSISSYVMSYVMYDALDLIPFRDGPVENA